jgi:spermidine/putrescine transport system ATP-binding protein
MIPAIELRSTVKRFGSVTAVDRVSLTIRDGEFFSLLGPSGCGKTTTLRMIAGFEFPDAGDIVLHGVSIGTTPPHRRRVNTVFQSYALFPHMTVADNIGFGLEMKRVAARARGARARQARRLRRALAATTLRRAAAARRARARPDQPARGLVARRAARRARPEAAQRDAA